MLTLILIFMRITNMATFSHKSDLFDKFTQHSQLLHYPAFSKQILYFIKAFFLICFSNGTNNEFNRLKSIKSSEYIYFKEREKEHKSIKKNNSIKSYNKYLKATITDIVSWFIHHIQLKMSHSVNIPATFLQIFGYSCLGLSARAGSFSMYRR